MRLLCSCTSQQARYQQRKKHSSTPDSRRLNYELTLGLLWGVIAGSVKVASDPPPTDTVGSSSMTITAALVLFAALWASVLKRKESRLEQVRYKI